MKTTTYTLAAVFGICALATGNAILMKKAYPESGGKEWLEKQGYTQVTGGENISLLNACGKNIASRTYEAINSEGKKATLTVCKGPFGYHPPLFGN